MWKLDLQMMMDAMKAENEKLAAAGGGGEGDSKLQEMLAAKQAELMVISLLRRRIAPVLTPFEVEPWVFARERNEKYCFELPFWDVSLGEGRKPVCVTPGRRNAIIYRQTSRA